MDGVSRFTEHLLPGLEDTFFSLIHIWRQLKVMQERPTAIHLAVEAVMPAIYVVVRSYGQHDITLQFHIPNILF
jgi:hypothetical protein